MTVNEALEDLDLLDEPTVLDIGFVNADGDDEETQLTAEGIEDFKELWRGFCRENDIETDSILYIEEGEED